MKITFFIGNGYDINLGLKTSYPDFLNWYIKQPSKCSEVEIFKNLIRSNIKYWSDLEIALGKKTLDKPLSTKNGLKLCKQDLDIHLKEYLDLQNQRIRLPTTTDIDTFRRSIVKFPLLCSSGHRRSLQAVYNSHGIEEYEYNIINFNFTNTVDIFWNRISSSAFWHDIRFLKVMPDEVFRTIDIKGKLVHVHGTLAQSMITGVGEASQLENIIYQKSQEITNVIVKPIMNENCRNDVEQEVSEIINSTDIFVVYGMSIGITDVKWWKKVVSRLLKESNTYLVIINYDSEYDPALPYTSSNVAMKIIQNLFEVSDCPQEIHQILKDKITVLLNTDLFNYESILAT